MTNATVPTPTAFTESAQVGKQPRGSIQKANSTIRRNNGGNLRNAKVVPNDTQPSIPNGAQRRAG